MTKKKPEQPPTEQPPTEQTPGANYTPYKATNWRQAIALRPGCLDHEQHGSMRDGQVVPSSPDLIGLGAPGKPPRDDSGRFQ